MNKTVQFVLILSIAVTLLAASSGNALAAMRGCRSDPHFHLSNGVTVTVTLEIGTDILNVKNIHYIVHVPAGVTLKTVTFTAKSDKKAINETYVVYQDNPANTYTTDTIVTTQTTEPIAVTVFSRVNGVSEKSISGFNSQHLVSRFSLP